MGFDSPAVWNWAPAGSSGIGARAVCFLCVMLHFCPGIGVLCGYLAGGAADRKLARQPGICLRPGSPPPLRPEELRSKASAIGPRRARGIKLCFDVFLTRRRNAGNRLRLVTQASSLINSRPGSAKHHDDCDGEEHGKGEEVHHHAGEFQVVPRERACSVAPADVLVRVIRCLHGRPPEIDEFRSFR